MKLAQNEIIQLLRRRTQLNQGKFGALAFNTSFESGRTKVKNIELGRQMPTQKDLENMAAVLGVPVTELIPDDRVPERTETEETTQGVWIGRELFDAFQGLEDYIGMLEKAVKVNDRDLIDYLANKISQLFMEGMNMDPSVRRFKY